MLYDNCYMFVYEVTYQTTKLRSTSSKCTCLKSSSVKTTYNLNELWLSFRYTQNVMYLSIYTFI